MRGLPDWFGIEDAIVSYVRDIQSMETWVAESGGDSGGDSGDDSGGDDGFAGFLTLNQHNKYSAEIHVMAVADSYHGQGCGRQLIEHAEQMLCSRSVEFLQVKTLSSSRPDAYYERTRGFYQHMGFKPFEENQLWGEQNPCLIMVKHLGRG